MNNPPSNDLLRLLQLAYLSDGDEKSPLRQLAAAVEAHLDAANDDDGGDDDERVERAIQAAAQGGWDEAFAEVKEVARAAAEGIVHGCDPADLLEGLLSEIGVLAVRIPGPRQYHGAVMLAPKVSPTATIREFEAAPLTLRRKGGKQQQAAVAYLVAAGGSATYEAVRLHLVASGTHEKGVYGVLGRAIASGLVQRLDGGLLGLPSND